MNNNDKKDKDKKKPIFSGEEILVRDKDGKFKIFKNGDLVDVEKYGSKDKDEKQESQPKTKAPAPPALTEDISSSLKESVDSVVQKSDLNITDESLKKRLRNIITARLKDIRDGFETKDILMRSVKIGGFGLKKEQAQRVARLADKEFEKNYKRALSSFEKYKEKPEFKEEPLPSTPSPKPVAGAPQPKAVEEPSGIESQAQAKKEKKKFAPPPPSLPLEEEEKPAYKAPVKQISKEEKIPVQPEKLEIVKEEKKPEEKKAPEQKIKLEKEKPERPEEKAKEPEMTAREEKIKPRIEKKEEKVKISARPKPEKGRPRMEDVKYTPKLVGPVDELAKFTLVDFHRLSEKPDKAADKIYEKIELLGEDSFAKKLAGIKSWRQSELNQLYLDLIYEGLKENMNLEQAINLRGSQNMPTLNLEEFQAIMDLNKKIRF